jgi:hypothetical protein
MQEADAALDLPQPESSAVDWTTLVSIGIVVPIALSALVADRKKREEDEEVTATPLNTVAQDKPSGAAAQRHPGSNQWI